MQKKNFFGVLFFKTNKSFGEKISMDYYLANRFYYSFKTSNKKTIG
jgi:hypothetical protein